MGTGEIYFPNLVKAITNAGLVFSNNSNDHGIHIRTEIRAKPQSKKSKIEIVDGRMVVAVNSPPVDGKANSAIIEVLSKSLGIPKSHIEIVRGHESKNKLFDLYFLEKEGKDEKYYIEKWNKMLGTRE